MTEINSEPTLIEKYSQTGKYEVNLKKIWSLTKDSIEQLIENSWNINEIDDHQETPLHLACRHNLAIVPELIKQGGQPSFFNYNIEKELPVQFILDQFSEKSEQIKDQAVNTFKVMMDYGIDLNQTVYLNNHFNGKTKNNNKQKIETDLHTELSFQFNNLSFEQKDQLLENIIKHQSINTRSHFDHGNNLLQSIFMSSTLNELFYSQSQDNIELFKKYNLDFDKINDNGENVLFSYLSQHISMPSGFYNQAMLLDNVVQLSQQVNNMDCCNLSQNNCLHLALYNDNPELVNFFINQGIDPNQKDFNKQNALMLACEYSTQSIDLILPHIKNINETNDIGQTSLFILIKNHFNAISNESYAELLLFHGADSLIKNNQGHDVWDELDKKPTEDRYPIKNRLQNKFLKNNNDTSYRQPISKKLL